MSIKIVNFLLGMAILELRRKIYIKKNVNFIQNEHCEHSYEKPENCKVCDPQCKSYVL